MKKGKWLVAILIVLGLGASMGCSRLEKPIINARKYEPFKEKAYPAPTKYIQVNGTNMAYIEKGEGPTVILIHGGVIPMSVENSFMVTTLWDGIGIIAGAVPGVFIGGTDLTMTFGLGYLGGFYIFPHRAKSLIHMGAVSTIDTWQYNFDEMAESFNVIAIDLPGFGNSEKPDIDYTVTELSAYLNGFMQSKGIERASLVGHDLGGLVAIDFSLTHPEKVTSMVLISPYGTAKHEGIPDKAFNILNFSHYPRPVGKFYQKEKAGQVNIWLPLIKMGGKHTYRRILNRFQPDIMGASDSWGENPAQLIHLDEGNATEFMDKVVEYKFQYIKTKEFSDELHATHLALVDIGRYDWWNILKMDPEKRTDWITKAGDIQAPTLVVWGYYDPSFSGFVGTYMEAEYLDAAIQNSMINIFENSAHYPMVEEAEKFNKDVMIFLEGSTE